MTKGSSPENPAAWIELRKEMLDKSENMWIEQTVTPVWLKY